MKIKLALPSFEISPPIELGLGWLLYFKIAAFTGYKRFKLKPIVFSLGKFLLVTVVNF